MMVLQLQMVLLDQQWAGRGQPTSGGRNSISGALRELRGYRKRQVLCTEEYKGCGTWDEVSLTGLPEAGSQMAASVPLDSEKGSRANLRQYKLFLRLVVQENKVPSGIRGRVCGIHLLENVILMNDGMFLLNTFQVGF